MNILIIDDHELVKEGIIARIKKVQPKAQCFFVHNTRLVHKTILEKNVNLIFCDLEFSNNEDIDGFYLAQRIFELAPKIKMIALTNYKSYRIMKKAISSGFHSFLHKGCSVEDFCETLINVMASGIYESSTMKYLFKRRYQFRDTIFSDSMNGIASLSDREKEITLLASETIDKHPVFEKH